VKAPLSAWDMQQRSSRTYILWNEGESVGNGIVARRASRLPYLPPLSVVQIRPYIRRISVYFRSPLYSPAPVPCALNILFRDSPACATSTFTESRVVQHGTHGRDAVRLTLCGTKVKAPLSVWDMQQRNSRTYVLWHEGESAIVSMRHAAEKQLDLHPVAQR
jgi:hypothetical protein